MSAAESLSAREADIARRYADGETYQSIATALNLAPSTVRTHLSAIYRKLGVSSKLELHASLTGSAEPPVAATDQASVISELALSLEEAIRREEALSEVLRIISRSDGDVAAVMSAILGHALDLCEAEFGILFEHVGDRRFRASHTRGIPGPFAGWLDEQGTFAAGPDTGLGRMERVRETVNIIDVRSEAVYRTGDPLRAATADLGGARSFVAIPMIAAERLVGAFTIYRQRVRPFDDKAVSVAATFADQSVIAMENARMVQALRTALQR